MLVGAAVLLAVALLTGGRLQRIGAVGFRANWLLLAAIGTQVLILETPLRSAPEAILAAVHVGTYAVAGVWVWCNRRVPGLMVLGVGGLFNLLAIAANGGVMPAYPQAIATAGIEAEAGFSNSAASTRSLLWFLGDIFAIPRSLPFANVFSLGDILILVGAGVFLMTTTRDRALDAAPGAASPAPEPAAAVRAATARPEPLRAPVAAAPTRSAAGTHDDDQRETPSREVLLQALVAHLSREVATLEAAAAAAHGPHAGSPGPGGLGQGVQAHAQQVEQRDRGELTNPLTIAR